MPTVDADWFDMATQADRAREDRSTAPAYAKRYSEVAITDALTALLEINRHRGRDQIGITFFGTSHPGAESAMRAFAKKHSKLVELREDKNNDALYITRRDNFHEIASLYRRRR